MTTEVETSKVFIIANRKSGNATPEQLQETLASAMGERFSDCRLHEMKPGEDIEQTARGAVEEGFDTIVAAGGDGSVSAVANAVVGTPARLGIIPLGTTNVLARELGIPVALDQACALLAGPGRTVSIDAMKVGDKHYFTQIGIGVDSLMIRDTKTSHKKRFGMLAYLWTAGTRLIGFQPHRFSISADGRRVRPRAVQVLLANCGKLGASELRWGPDVCVHDGKIDICILRARSLLTYLIAGCNVALGRHREDRNIQYLTAEKVVAIHADRPLPVQGDGEVIGNTPLEVQVVPRALRVLVPAEPKEA
jgi:YegS/Rv2252/BmrU family lipid kinase